MPWWKWAIVVSFEPSTWSAWVWFLYAFAGAYLLGFVWFFVRFEQEERKAMAGDQAALDRFNRLLVGFPNAFYAKMLGKRRLESADEAPAKP